MTDFFISYTGVDSGWAEWIAFTLEEKGFNTIVQAWDFRPGSNFVLEMQNAMTVADRTIMVLSPAYLKSMYAAPEWAGAFTQDPEGTKRKLVPVMVEACQPQGLLAPIVHISIVGVDETAAREKLLAGLNATRAKPTSRPAFPGAAAASNPQKAFPRPAGDGQPAGPGIPAYRPTVHRPPTDIDKRRFVKQSFATIRALFESGLQALEQQGLEHDFTATSETDFRAEIFLDGRSRCFCRIWLGGMHSQNNICFGETRTGGDSCNEIISLSDRREELNLSATMSMGYGPFERAHDMKRLTPDEAADYLWHRFVAPLER